MKEFPKGILTGIIKEITEWIFNESILREQFKNKLLKKISNNSQKNFGLIFP